MNNNIFYIDKITKPEYVALYNKLITNLHLLKTDHNDKNKINFIISYVLGNLFEKYVGMLKRNVRYPFCSLCLFYKRAVLFWINRSFYYLSNCETEYDFYSYNYCYRASFIFLKHYNNILEIIINLKGNLNGYEKYLFDERDNIPFLYKDYLKFAKK